MNRTVAAGLVAAACGVAMAQEPNWGSMPYTTHAAYEAVNVSGVGTFALTAPVKIRGVLLNRPQHMLSPAPAPWFLGGQWQVTFQAIGAGDFGGTTCWVGQRYGDLPFVGDPAYNYTDAEWLDETYRLGHDPATGRAFRPGDLVEIRARAPGLFRAGKTNINEKHNNDPANDFDIILLEPGRGLPAPAVLPLSELKDASDQFIFDSTRATGCERYQGTVVRFDNVSFVSTVGWGPGASLTVQDNGSPVRTFPVLLGLGSGFSAYAAPTGTFSIVGILDQEDLNGGDGLKQGYRLWVMDYDSRGFVLPQPASGDFDDDGDVDGADYGHFAGCFNGSGNAVALLCRDADLDKDNDVDGADYGVFAGCFNGSGNPANCQR